VLPDLLQLYSVDRKNLRLPNKPLRTVQLQLLHSQGSQLQLDETAAGSGATGASPAIATKLTTENNNVKNTFIFISLS